MSLVLLQWDGPFLCSVSILNQRSDHINVARLGRTTRIGIQNKNTVLSMLFFVPFDENRKLCYTTNWWRTCWCHFYGQLAVRVVSRTIALRVCAADFAFASHEQRSKGVIIFCSKSRYGIITRLSNQFIPDMLSATFIRLWFPTY